MAALKGSVSLLSSVVKLASGNVAAQIIPFVALPFLARLYSPQDFGHLAFFMALCTFLSILMALRFDVALVSVSEAKQKMALLSAGRRMAIFLACCIFIILSIALLAGIVNQHYGWFLPVSALALAIHNLHVGWLNANEHYSAISGFLVLRALLWVGIAGAWPFVLPEVELGIVYAFAASYILVSVIEYCFIAVLTSATALEKVSVIQVVKAFKDFPKFNLPHALLSNVNASAPAYVLQFFGLTQILGQFSQTNRLIMTPWHMVSNALYRVLYQHCAKTLQSEHPNLSKVGKLWGGYSAVAIVFYFILYFIATPLFILVLGEQWREAGRVAQIMMPWFALRTITGVLAFMPILREKQHIALIFEMFYTGAMIASLGLGAVLYDGLTALSWFSWVGTFFVLIQLSWYLGLIKSKP
ncbi:lipopolysaccharide biosynthesis protein [Alteromonas sp. a30]|uniref:lipopolysaccharide biosynthesis protein n=1 Tax=Alteromonas sp. a30 TaxID=2730917 RepID=UPI002280A9B5|nr:oligosaccharide flippase family protein [Alteromonas sp. a30]MCY7294387.1 oligosaccharide flippase family protein [Alteromonas sp. a30]